MKWICVCVWICVAACTCPKIQLSYNPPTIDLLLKYGNGPGEFDMNDSVFRLYVFTDNSRIRETHIITTHPSAPSGAFINIYTIPADKVFMESLSSDFRDTLYNLNVKSRSVRKGRGKCSGNSTEFFDIECTYRGKTHINHENGSMSINIIK